MVFSKYAMFLKVIELGSMSKAAVQLLPVCSKSDYQFFGKGATTHLAKPQSDRHLANLRR